MIFDTLENCSFYYGLHKNFEKAFDFIKKAEKENLPAGRYDFGGEEVYAIVQEYDSKNPLDYKFEGHRKYIDIQYISSGIEVIEVLNINKAIPHEDYIDARDVAFLESGNNIITATMEKGEYGIFWPRDIHKPGLHFEGNSSPVKKILVKVKL